MRALDLQISVNGWVVLTVGEGEEAFTYTVGLVEHYDHPELIVVDLAREHQYELINTLAQKYQENLKAVDARIEELKAANQGLVQKALNAVIGVIQTIIRLVCIARSARSLACWTSGWSCRMICSIWFSRTSI